MKRSISPGWLGSSSFMWAVVQLYGRRSFVYLDRLWLNLVRSFGISRSWVWWILFGLLGEVKCWGWVNGTIYLEGTYHSALEMIFDWVQPLVLPRGCAVFLWSFFPVPISNACGVFSTVFFTLFDYCELPSLFLPVQFLHAVILFSVGPWLSVWWITFVFPWCFLLENNWEFFGPRCPCLPNLG